MKVLLSVYPRWRGEHVSGDTVYNEIMGLSPLARGTLVLLAPAVNNKRFIPAGAGNTIRGISDPHTVTVYPRWRGEHTVVASKTFPAGGLSPLARGTHPERFVESRNERFIPAGAGNTSP